MEQREKDLKREATEMWSDMKKDIYERQLRCGVTQHEKDILRIATEIWSYST